MIGVLARQHFQPAFIVIHDSGTPRRGFEVAGQFFCGLITRLGVLAQELSQHTNNAVVDVLFPQRCLVVARAQDLLNQLAHITRKGAAAG